MRGLLFNWFGKFFKHGMTCCVFEPQMKMLLSQGLNWIKISFHFTTNQHKLHCRTDKTNFAFNELSEWQHNRSQISGCPKRITANNENGCERLARNIRFWESECVCAAVVGQVTYMPAPSAATVGVMGKGLMHSPAPLTFSAKHTRAFRLHR